MKEQSGWAVRLANELKNAETAYFLTLTYKDELIHMMQFGHMNEKKSYTLEQAIQKDDFTSMIPKLDISHLRLFLSRLKDFARRDIETIKRELKVSKMSLKIDSKVKHFVVGEYGSKNNRPHWHLLLFNFPYSKEDTLKLITRAWSSSKETQTQQFGFCHIGDVEGGSIDYVTGYLMKNERINEIRLISQGIGAKYINKKTINYHQKTLDGIVRTGTTTGAMPRYYSTKIFNEKQRKQIGIRGSDHFADELQKNPLLIQEQHERINQKIKHKKSKK